MKKGLSRKGVYIFLALCIAVLMLAIACSTPASTPATTPATTKAPTSAPATTVQPQSGGILKFGENQEFAQIGFPPTQQNVRQYPLYDICLENLVLLNRAGEPIPWLATDWKYDAGVPSLTLNLKQGVKFHDGTDFNAAVVKWNLEKNMEYKQPRVAAIKSVDVVSDYTVRLNLSVQDTFLIIFLANQPGQMMSQTAYQNGGTTEEQRSIWAKSHPVGTGPFKFVSWERDVKTVFTKNENYWQKGKPYLDGIEFITITNEATLLASFKAGELDAMYTELPQNIKQVEEAGKFTLLEGDIGLVGGLEPDSMHQDSPWANIKVRQAAAYAVDNQALAQAIGLGYYMPTNQLDAPGRWGYNPNVKGYPYNPTKAKQLLAEAGYPSGFTTMINAMNTFGPLVTAFQGYLADVGIKAEANLVTPPKLLEMYSKGWTGVNMWQATCQPSALAIFNTTFSTAGQPGRANSLYVPPEWQAILAKAVADSNFENQKTLTWQLQAEFIDKYAVVNFAFAQKMPLPMQKKVHDLNTGVAMHWTPYNVWKEK